MTDETKPPQSDAAQPTRVNGQWIGIGLAMGAAFGAAFDNVGIGVALGLAVGAAIDAQQATQRNK